MPATRSALVVALSLLALGAPASRSTATEGKLSPRQQLGKSLFFDIDLSVGRNQSCAMCHAPDAGFTSPREDVNGGGGVIEGSVAGRFGSSKPPSVAYAQAPVLYHTRKDGKLVFVGGAFWNGRATGKRTGNALADQAQGPFLNPLEMGLPDAACVVQRACKPANSGLYPVALADVWGAEVCRISLPADLEAACANPAAKIKLDKKVRKAVEETYDKIALSIAAYEVSTEVNRYSSKLDRYLDGKAELTAQEKLGLALFKEKGKCANCHVLDPAPDGGPPLLTDFTYDNLGVPRNPSNPFYRAKANPRGAGWVEAGLPVALAKDPIYSDTADGQRGKVKVPTLRNVDLRPTPRFVKAYMHNGYFKTLKGVVHFYNTRDVKPRCASRLVREAEAMRQGCWPEPEVEENLNTEEMGNLKLTDAEEDAIVAFMLTLTDGYAPGR